MYAAAAFGAFLGLYDKQNHFLVAIVNGDKVRLKIKLVVKGSDFHISLALQSWIFRT